MTLSRLVPTMFHRRLLLLLALIVAATGGLAVQLSVLTIARADDLRAAAEAKLESVQWLPTVRGRILDRKGRVLAQDRPSFDLAVHYRVISGAWAEERAGLAARRLHPSQWREMDQEARRELVERYAAVYRAHLERGWGLIASTAGLPGGRDEVELHRQAVVERVETLAQRIVNVRQRKGIASELARGREITTEVEEEIDRRARADIRETATAQVVIPRIPDRVGFEFVRLGAEKTDLVAPDGATLEEDVPLIPGLEVVSAAEREYPYDTLAVRIDRSSLPSPIASEAPADVTVTGVLIHALGWMGRNATAEDVKERGAHLAADPGLAERSSLLVGGRRYDRGRYEIGDPVGRFGVEAGREESLRGLSGLRVRRFDTGEEREIAAEPGRDQHLTIDVNLQARVQAVMDPALALACVQPWHALPTHDAEGRPIPGTDIGTPLYGGAVVLDVETGDILSMVSTPGFTREALRADASQIFEDPFRPWINRVVSGAYPPGSIAKPLVLAAAVTLGRHSLAHPIECNGHLLPHDPNSLRCWIYKRSQNEATPHTHTLMLGHALDAREGLMVSCNIYFFTLGRQLGIDGIRRAYEMFGLGRGWDLGVARPGHPDDEFAGRIGGLGAHALSIGDAIQMGIGQGPVAWTPLHAADALATLARGGVRVTPRLLVDAPVSRTDLHLDPGGAAAALDGLSLAVNDHRGTGHSIAVAEHVREPIFNAPGVHVWGKTGTAEAPRLLDDPDGPGPGRPRLIRDGDHSWFVVLVGREGGPPRYAIAVMMEYAGSGGKVSGPICNQIIHALIAEGYL